VLLAASWTHYLNTVSAAGLMQISDAGADRCIVTNVQRDVLHLGAVACCRGPAPAEYAEPGRGKLTGGGLADA